MVIKEEQPISMPEVLELVGDSEKGKRIRDFIKGFSPMKTEDAKKLINDLRELKIVKLKDSYIVKIVDFKPTDATQLNKVLSEITLESEDVTKILDIVKKY
jgi:DNA-directed RNA polymerase subunit F